MRNRVCGKRPIRISACVGSAWRFDVFLPLALGGEDVEDEAVRALPSVRHRPAHAEEILGALLHPIRVKTVHSVLTLLSLDRLRRSPSGLRP